MGPMIKRRRILDGPSTSIVKNISTFGRVSKASTLLLQYKKEDLHESDEDRKHKPAFRATRPNKRQREEELEEGLREQAGNIVRLAVNQDIKKTPRKKVRFAADGETTQTPTKGNRSLLESFVISSPEQKTEHFDEEIQDIIDLHKAFLNSLAIHYAHHGTASPVSIQALIPRIELKWGKRRITIQDIRRILGIQHTTEHSALSLVERTISRICIEWNTEFTSPLPVETLKKAFLIAIRKLQGQELPLEEIRFVAPAENIFFSKGAQRLKEIKALAIEAQSTLPATRTILPQATETPVNRATSLLDRIRNKENLASTLPAPPSAEAIARKASLQRLEEIIPILEVLSGSSPKVSGRNLYGSTTSLASLSALGSSLGLGPAPPPKVVSFTMGTIVQHLQNSLRHPIAKEEVDRAVRLLADEVASRWVSVRDVGNVVGVTFRGKISRAEWIAKLNGLLG